MMPANVQQLMRRNRISAERAGQRQIKNFLGSVRRERGMRPFYCLGTHHSPDSCNFALVPFLTAQLKKYRRREPQNRRVEEEGDGQGQD